MTYYISSCGILIGITNAFKVQTNSTLQMQPLKSS